MTVEGERLPEGPPEGTIPPGAGTTQPPPGPPSVIQITAPPPFDAPELQELVTLFMERRGLKDKTQAAIKLANACYSMGINPMRDIKNVETYINNMSAVLASIPDTPETAPVKGSLLARTAAESSQLLGRTHFPEMTEDQEMKEMVRYGTRVGMTMRMLDNAFRGGGTTENSEVKVLKERLERIEKAKEQEALIKPLQDSIGRLEGQIKELSEGGGKKGVSDDVQKVLDAVKDVNTRIDKMEEKYAWSQEIQALKTEFSTVKTEIANIGKNGGTSAERLTDLLDSITTIQEKLIEMQKKAGGKGTPEGELDWRSVTVSSFTELGKEAIHAYRDIETGKGSEGEEKKEETKVPEKILERRVYKYCLQKVRSGILDINTRQGAEDLGVSVEEFWDALTSLKAKGLLSAKALREQGALPKPGTEKGVEGGGGKEAPGVETEGKPRGPLVEAE